MPINSYKVFVEIYLPLTNRGNRLFPVKGGLFFLNSFLSLMLYQSNVVGTISKRLDKELVI